MCRPKGAHQIGNRAHCNVYCVVLFDKPMQYIISIHKLEPFHYLPCITIVKKKSLSLLRCHRSGNNTLFNTCTHKVMKDEDPLPGL